MTVKIEVDVHEKSLHEAGLDVNFVGGKGYSAGARKKPAVRVVGCRSGGLNQRQGFCKKIFEKKKYTWSLSILFIHYGSLCQRRKV
jgi:hypothetical protein